MQEPEDVFSNKLLGNKGISHLYDTAVLPENKN